MKVSNSTKKSEISLEELLKDSDMNLEEFLDILIERKLFKLGLIKGESLEDCLSGI